MAPQKRLNAYRIMWLLVFFDLPTDTKKQRYNYSQFRKKLLKDGFTMMQLSVYTRHCPTRENMEVHLKRVERFLPPEGQVSILEITDKQYSKIRNYWGKEAKRLESGPGQLELF